MPCDHQTAINEMTALFRTAWLAAGGLDANVDYEGVPNSVPPQDGQTTWARFRILFSDDAGQATLAGNTGNTRYRNNGAIIVQVFGKSGDGLQEVTNFARLIMVAYRGITTSGGVWFKGHRIQHVGQEGSWSQRNVVVEFQFDEIG